MRRWLACVWLIVLVGCVPPEQEAKPKSGDPSGLPPDLRTRKTGTDWPCFLGPTGDSVSSEKGIITPWPKAGPRSSGRRSSASATPCRRSAGAGCSSSTATATRPASPACKSETGEVLWKFEYPDRLQGSLRLQQRPALLPRRRRRPRLHLRRRGHAALPPRPRTASCSGRWTPTTEFGVVQNFFGVGSTPVVEGDLLIAQVGGSPKGSDEAPISTTSRATAAAWSPSTSTPARSSTEVTDELASYSSPVLATIDERRWCFVFARGGLVGFEPATGKVDFHYPWRAKILESVNASNPVVVGDRVFISETYGPGQRPAARCSRAATRWSGATPTSAATRACSATG